MPKNAPPAVRGANEVPETPVNGSRNSTLQVLIGPEQGAPNFLMRRFTIPPGDRIPKHLHDSIEHEQWVLEGEMILGLGDREVTVRAGDAIFIPAGTAHWYENRGDVPVRFLCMVPRTDHYRTEWLEES